MLNAGMTGSWLAHRFGFDVSYPYILRKRLEKRTDLGPEVKALIRRWDKHSPQALGAATAENQVSALDGGSVAATDGGVRSRPILSKGIGRHDDTRELRQLRELHAAEPG